MILDAHSHTLPSCPGTAIVSSGVDDWHPLPGHIYAVGIHPWHIVDDGEEQLARLEAILQSDASGQIRMMGEMGLDKRRGPALDIQQDVFAKQIALSHSYGMTVVVHDVHAMTEILALRHAHRSTMPWLIHGFRGGPEQARQYLRAGCHVSLGSHYRADTLLALPPDELFLESDDNPDTLAALYDDVARCLRLPVETVEQRVNDNILRFLDV